MKDFKKEIMAYSLQNAIEFGKADAGKILPKLFQHGLKKEDIKKVLPLIEKAVKEFNSMKDEDRTKAVDKFKGIVKVREEESRDLPSLPGSERKTKMTLRVAPFPSGALHIGHAKTFVLNALYAEEYNAKLILVMDDTIGSAEKPLTKEGYRLIEEAFDWLAIKYSKPIVYKSNRIPIYYKYAKKLIEKEKAYVCHCSADELRKNRFLGIECSCRQFPTNIQNMRWKEMFHEKEGHATLRIKTNMQDPNPAFRDRVLFKISDRTHPRVGNKYRVWPTLEMSWAIDDHLLRITHIIRGNDLAIETKMEKYIWDIFKWKHPVAIHTGLVRIKGLGSKVSKSKSQKQVLSGEYIGWDDPRTWSLQSLAKRGITCAAVRQFVKDIGLNKQDITIPIDTLYSLNRGIVDRDANRYSLVVNPRELNIGESPVNKVRVPIHPNKDKFKELKVGKIYISEEDFAKFEGKEIRLLNLFNVILGNKTIITSRWNKKIPKINWVSESVKASVLMPEGNIIKGIAEKTISRIKNGELIQFERFGFCNYESKKKGVYQFWFAHK